MVLFMVFLFPANLFWYVLSVTGFTEPYFNGVVEAFLCPWQTGRFFHPLSWGPFLFDCVFSVIAWVVFLKVLGVKL
jgi:hypothetical protein